VCESGAPEVQKYFQSGFPYDHDQWISMAGTAGDMALTWPGTANLSRPLRGVPAHGVSRSSIQPTAHPTATSFVSQGQLLIEPGIALRAGYIRGTSATVPRERDSTTRSEHAGSHVV